MFGMHFGIFRIPPSSSPSKTSWSVQSIELWSSSASIACDLTNIHVLMCGPELPVLRWSMVWADARVLRLLSPKRSDFTVAGGICACSHLIKSTLWRQGLAAAHGRARDLPLRRRLSLRSCALAVHRARPHRAHDRAHEHGLATEEARTPSCRAGRLSEGLKPRVAGTWVQPPARSPRDVAAQVNPLWEWPIAGEGSAHASVVLLADLARGKVGLQQVHPRDGRCDARTAAVSAAEAGAGRTIWRKLLLRQGLGSGAASPQLSVSGLDE